MIDLFADPYLVKKTPTHYFRLAASVVVMAVFQTVDNLLD